MGSARPNSEQTPTQHEPVITQEDAVKVIARLPRRVTSLLWALTALHATLRGAGATYRAIAVICGIADKKNVRAVVRAMERENLVSTTRNGKLAVVHLTIRARTITTRLLHIMPYEETKHV